MVRHRPPSNGGGEWFSPAVPRILAHRGFALDVPENTLAAFEAALGLGVLYIETDIHVSKDGIAMVAHDPSLIRVAGVDSAVCDLTTEELQTIDLGGGHRMPTLLDALVAFPLARFNIDVKSPGAGAAVASAVLEAEATERVLITSFSSRRRREAIDLLPRVASSASAARFVLILALAKLGLLAFVPPLVGGVDAVQVPPHYGRLAIATARVIRALHRRGIEMHIWTVNDPQKMHRLLMLGVDGIVTDRPDLALELLRRIRPPHEAQPLG
ncbi:glycerophosphodiester phosphodiesterase family protein [Agreia pratensis]|uniref:Glycerophosphoryl diester phosphodiesterase n=1 Tax=Agreia pratensis TaxID=150121 RepID=A0A1X7KDH4_9MICO|nr:glycerophosphodiester phosphodiesterase family protein [Agreia pratensis]SMG38930.1 glycerophosphoryl diester phosphodiesterase [Agreia pratensis]